MGKSNCYHWGWHSYKNGDCGRGVDRLASVREGEKPAPYNAGVAPQLQTWLIEYLEARINGRFYGSAMDWWMRL